MGMVDKLGLKDGGLDGCVEIDGMPEGDAVGALDILGARLG